MSELKVNVISEVTGANGVVVDSVKLKDGGIVIADAGNIGSVSDVDAIAIGSDGDITLTLPTCIVYAACALTTDIASQTW